MRQEQLYQQISERKTELQQLIREYWYQTSNVDTWYFWLNLFTFFIPLIILYFAIDKKRLFEICFYGYTVHVVWGIINSVLSENSYLLHTHQLSYFLPDGFNMNSVVLPVAFMLLYQYSTNHRKNVYLWAIFGSIFFAFIYAPIEAGLDMVHLEKGMNYFYIFLIDLFVTFFAYWVTLLFQWVKRKHIGKQMNDRLE